MDLVNYITVTKRQITSTMMCFSHINDVPQANSKFCRTVITDSNRVCSSSWMVL